MQEDEIVTFLKDNADKGSEYYTDAIRQFHFCELERDLQINVNKCPEKKAFMKDLRDKELAAKLAPCVDGIWVAAQDADQKVRAGAFVVIEDHRIKKR